MVSASLITIGVIGILLFLFIRSRGSSSFVLPQDSNVEEMPEILKPIINPTKALKRSINESLARIEAFLKPITINPLSFRGSGRAPISTIEATRRSIALAAGQGFTSQQIASSIDPQNLFRLKTVDPGSFAALQALGSNVTIAGLRQAQKDLLELKAGL